MYNTVTHGRRSKRSAPMAPPWLWLLPTAASGVGGGHSGYDWPKGQCGFFALALGTLHPRDLNLKSSCCHDGNALRDAAGLGVRDGRTDGPCAARRSQREPRRSAAGRAEVAAAVDDALLALWPLRDRPLWQPQLGRMHRPWLLWRRRAPRKCARGELPEAVLGAAWAALPGAFQVPAARLPPTYSLMHTACVHVYTRKAPAVPSIA